MRRRADSERRRRSRRVAGLKSERNRARRAGRGACAQRVGTVGQREQKSECAPHDCEHARRCRCSSASGSRRGACNDSNGSLTPHGSITTDGRSTSVGTDPPPFNRLCMRMLCMVWQAYHRIGRWHRPIHRKNTIPFFDRVAHRHTCILCIKLYDCPGVLCDISSGSPGAARRQKSFEGAALSPAHPPRASSPPHLTGCAQRLHRSPSPLSRSSRRRRILALFPPSPPRVSADVAAAHRRWRRQVPDRGETRHATQI